MCVPGCLEAIARGSGRVLAPSGLTRSRPARRRSFSRVVDLTHAMGPDFPSFDPGASLATEPVAALARDGYNMLRWHLIEHTGTHLDAPLHYADQGASADLLKVEDLVVPLAVVDIAAKARDDPDALVTPDDLAAFEAVQGPIPAHAWRRTTSLRSRPSTDRSRPMPASRCTVAGSGSSRASGSATPTSAA